MLLHQRSSTAAYCVICLMSYDKVNANHHYIHSSGAIHWETAGNQYTSVVLQCLQHCSCAHKRKPSSLQWKCTISSVATWLEYYLPIFTAQIIEFFFGKIFYNKHINVLK